MSADAGKKSKKDKSSKSKKDAAKDTASAKSERDVKAKPKEKRAAYTADPSSSTSPQKQSAKPQKQKQKAKPEPTPLPTSTILDAPASSSSSVKLPPSPHWYTLLPALSATTDVPTPTPTQLNTLTSRASSLLASLAPAPSTGSASDAAFLKSILSGGTLSDRLSALTLMAQGSPIHNTRALDALRNMAERGKGGGGGGGGGGGEGPKAGGREERLKAVRAIVDWWVGGGAPERKLRYFRDQPLLHPEVTNEYLLVWYFEDWLKKYFFAILQVLEALSLDPLPYVRTQALSLIATLLREKPEQEHNLLRLLVNKLGDTEKSIAARASYHLLQLLQAHPRMKQIVIRETTALILRPTSSTSATALQQPSTSAPKPKMHIKFDDDDVPAKKGPAKHEKPKLTPAQVHARYYAAITFNQIVLGPEEPDRAAARMLLDVYFSLFREVVGEREEAAPPPETNDEPASDVEEEESGKGGKGKGKGKSKSKEKQAMKKKEVKGAAGFAEVQDEHSRLVSAILTGVNRALPFARLGGGDVEFDRHMDTLFLITHTSTFNITLQALTLIQQIVAALPASPPLPVTARYFRTLYGSLLDPRLFGTAKQALYLNLLFKSMKSDPNAERVKAFVKRFCQVLANGFGGTEFVAGGLWLLGELFNTVPGLRDMVDKPPKVNEGEAYDPRKRDPQYAHASSSPLWELTPLLHHYHPTISLLARQLLTRAPLTTSPDLALHTLAHFLDRFVYKNPKKPATRGSSAMQPAAAAGDGTAVRRVRGDVQERPVNEEGWWKRSAASVPADQMFFHKYFSQKHEREQAMAAKVKKRKGKGEEDEDEDVDDVDADVDMQEEDGEEGEEDEDEDSAAEDEIWKAMKASMPELGGDADEDDDLSDDIPSGLDASDSEEDEDAESEADEEVDEEGGEDDAFSLAEGSDADDLLSLDADAPSGLIDYDGSDASADENEEWSGFGDAKRKRGKDEEKGGKKKKLRSLPTFASYEDYAKMIEDAQEDNV
ncbi:CBF-domain-containing protein [Dentipellis sp. KUC8613]|nr:CBF-domain-containing protein [Dentipellis sp. KUC8613]